MEGKFIDIHNHTCGYANPDAVIRRAKDKCVSKILAVPFDYISLQKNAELAVRHPDTILLSAAVHPNRFEKKPYSHINRDFKMISRFVRDNHISAIGETGLHYTQYNAYGHVREWQEELFRKHLDLAEDMGRMVIVHSLGSFSQALRVLKDYKLTVILHYPLGSYPVSKKTRRLIKTSVERGYYFSIAPKDRFGNLEEVSHLVAREVPKNRLLVESDGPRRKKIEPAVVVKIVDKICHDMKVSEDEAKKILYTNAMKLLEKQI